MKRKILYFVTVMALVLLFGVVLVACNDKPEYSRRHEFDQINANSVLHIEKTRLTFTKGMEVDSAQIIADCECEIEDSKTGKHIQILADDLISGIISYDKFDLSTPGRDKRIAVSFKKAKNYIFYDVIDFKVNYYEDKEMTKLWKSAAASSSLSTDGSLGLSVWIDTIENNYATDDINRTAEPQKAMRFNGWYDLSDNAITGRHVLSVPSAGTERVIDLYADFLSEEQVAGLKLRYDNAGRLVFYGYEGEKTDVLRLPEGVTYIDMPAVFDGVTAENPVNFKKLVIPSTARMDVPFTVDVNSAGLTCVEVDDGNPYMSSYKNAIYSKNYQSLYFMPASAPNDGFHEMLAEFASYSCAHWQIQALSLPESVTTLQNYCFAYSSLTSVAGLDRVSLKTGVFAGANVNSKEDGVALYTVLSGEGTNAKYSLSMVLDKDVTDYKVIKGTVDIAGDAFNGCEKLESIDLGTELKSIGGSAFSGCTSLKSVKLPKSLETLGSNVFYGCSALEKVEGLNDVTFADESKSYEHTLPSRMFYKCTSLTDVTLPDGIVTIAPSAFFECAALKSIQIPSTVKNIGASAFQKSGLTSVELPIGLKTFGKQAFADCESLATVNLDKCVNLETLAESCFNKSGLVNVKLPAQITVIPDSCFRSMANLVSIDISNITEIAGTYAIGQNSKLTTITFGNKLETVGTRAFSGNSALTSVVLPESVTTIGNYAFGSCTKLTSISIGSKVTRIGTYPLGSDGEFGSATAPVFFQCTNLKQITVDPNNEYYKSVDGVLYANSLGSTEYGDMGVLCTVPSSYDSTTFTVPDSVRVILPYAVSCQQKVTTVNLNEGLLNIGKGAFYYSRKLTSLTIPASVTHLGASILLNCDGIKSFYVTEGNQRYSADDGVVYDGNKAIMYLGLSEAVEIKSGITTIESAVFMNNTKITSVVIPDSVTTIGSKAFSGCTGLTSITIGAGVKTISADAFALLSSLKTITVSPSNQSFKAVNNVLYTKDGKKVVLVAAKNGMTSLAELESGVTEIGDYAFSYHATLASAVLPAGVKSIGDYAFYECRKIEHFRASEVLETIGERAFSFATSINPKDTKETRYCNTLKTVILYAGIKSIGDNAFFGQYGIQYLYLKMTALQTSELYRNCGTNYAHLIHGCSNMTTNERYNVVERCLYSATAPTIDYDGYSWFYFDENGDPKLYD